MRAGSRKLRILWRTTALAGLVLVLWAAVGVPGSSAHSSAATACPVAGQCAVNPKTGCPKGGPSSGPNAASPAPIQGVVPPEKCVSVPATLFYVSGRNATGCNEVLFVQVELQPGISQYESVVYSKIGEGTRWWADPSTPEDQTGPATHAGQTFTYGSASYTVPKGYLAWDVGGGSAGDPNGCHDSVPGPPTIYGFAGWGVKGTAASGGGAGAKISIHGPTHNAFHVTFNEVVTGTASGAANYVQSGEQLGWTPKCAPTLTAEESRSTWTAWPTGTGSVSGHFSLVAAFYSRNHLKHGICSYLINATTKHTYAHASRYWWNS